jgi:ABC-type uncharacterized transport system auxiliary subunit
MARREYRGAWLGLAAVLIGGCGFTAPRVRYFEVRPTSIERQEGATLPSITVLDFACMSTYDSVRVVVRRSPVEVVTSRNLQWTTVPGRMLAQGLRYRLEETGRFESIRRDTRVRPPYMVDGLVQVIELDKEPHLTARLALQVKVQRSVDGTVIREDFVEESEPADGNRPGDGVLALRDLYSHILDGLTKKIIAAIEHDLQSSGSVP